MTTTVRTPNQNQQIVDLQSVAMGEDGTGVLVQDTDTSYRARVSYTDFKEEGAGWWQVGERESNLGRITLIRASLIKAKPGEASRDGWSASLVACPVLFPLQRASTYWTHNRRTDSLSPLVPHPAPSSRKKGANAWTR